MRYRIVIAVLTLLVALGIALAKGVFTGHSSPAASTEQPGDFATPAPPVAPPSNGPTDPFK